MLRYIFNRRPVELVFQLDFQYVNEGITMGKELKNGPRLENRL